MKSLRPGPATPKPPHPWRARLLDAVLVGLVALGLAVVTLGGRRL